MTTPHPTALIARLPKFFCSHGPRKKLIAAPIAGSRMIQRMKLTGIGWSIYLTGKL